MLCVLPPLPSPPSGPPSSRGLYSSSSHRPLLLGPKGLRPWRSWEFSVAMRDVKHVRTPGTRTSSAGAGPAASHRKSLPYVGDAVPRGFSEYAVPLRGCASPLDLRLGFYSLVSVFPPGGLHVVSNCQARRGADWP